MYSSSWIWKHQIAYPPTHPRGGGDYHQEEEEEEEEEETAQKAMQQIDVPFKTRKKWGIYTVGLSRNMKQDFSDPVACNDLWTGPCCLMIAVARMWI